MKPCFVFMEQGFSVFEVMRIGALLSSNQCSLHFIQRIPVG